VSAPAKRTVRAVMAWLGSHTSPAKHRAAARNGKHGGWPAGCTRRPCEACGAKTGHPAGQRVKVRANGRALCADCA
jgi:hypothetical protein